MRRSARNASSSASVVTVGVADLHFTRADSADGPTSGEPVAPRDDRGGLCFGAGVELEDPLGAEPVGPCLFQPRRTRFGEMPDDSQRRQVGAERDLVVETQDPLHHRRNEIRDLDGVVALQQRLTRPHRRIVVVGRPETSMQPPGAMPNGGVADVSNSAGSPDTISFGKPPDPPDVGAFHAGEIASGRSSSVNSGGGLRPSGRCTIDSGRRANASSGVPMTTMEPASSTMSANSRAGSSADTGWSDAGLSAGGSPYSFPDAGRDPDVENNNEHE